MKSDERLFFTSLWRPLQMLGVPEDWMILTFGFGLGTYVTVSVVGQRILDMNLGAPLWGFAVGGLLFFYGRIRAKDDPEFLTVYLQKNRNLRKTKGEFIGNAYYPK
ncbi:MAG: VirB3 family type IV secretion system protein [Sphaerochaeta sp.]|nr:VirB3 family type IV secretion system protein [Sphaerochaeta sp.]